MLDDINPGSGSSQPIDPWAIAVVGNTLFFAANDGTDGEQLWQTDGTTAGTSMITVAGSSFLSDFVDFNGVLAFTAYTEYGTTLWRSDGTADGTYQISTADNAENLCVVGNTLYFAAMATSGYGLYKTDGTIAGTSLVIDSGDITPYWLANVNGTLYFEYGNSTSGAELWTSNGTSGGTIMVADINAGSSSSSPSQLTVVGNSLYFTANDGNDGAELWMLS